MPLSAGDKLGPYEILAPIGKGGMGEVYRAHDPRLNRDVAIKVAAERFSERFEREARAIASLNHPNICTLFDVGNNYLVMELVEGATFAERIKKGAIPLEEALALARQISDALAAAHDKGIVHRDLKPANLKITPQGVVKVLDFGLAKAVPEPSASEDLSILATESFGLTQTGEIVGTAAYMAPEQIQGMPASKRADIWAFGVVLYEMLTGRRMFRGGTLSDTLASVLRDEPEWARVPAQVQRLLRSCLEKDPGKRLRDIGDVWRLLDDAPVSGSQSATLASPSEAPGKNKKKWWWPAVAMLLLIAGGGWWILGRSTPNLEILRFQILEDGKFKLENSAPAVSPDGKWVAFQAPGKDGLSHIWLRALDSLDTRPIAGTESPNLLQSPPFWSSDSKTIVFAINPSPFAPGQMKRVDIAGGTPQVICEIQSGIAGMAWNPQGILLFLDSAKGYLQQVPASGGTPTPVTALPTGDRFHMMPQFLPGGRTFLYHRVTVSSQTEGIYAGSLDKAPTEQSTKPILITNREAYYSPAGRDRLIFLRGQTLFAQPFNLSTLTLTGQPEAVVDGVSSFAPASAGRFTISTDGVLAYNAGQVTPGRVTMSDRGSGKTLQVLGDFAFFQGVEVSPDSKRAATVRIDPKSGSTNIWVGDLGSGDSTKITFDSGRNSNPVWSPDGKSIIFASNRQGVLDLYIKKADGSGEERLILKTDQDKFPSSWSAKDFLMFESGGDLWVLPHPESNSQPVLYLRTKGTKAEEGRISPDDKWAAYTSTELGRSEVYIRPFDPQHIEDSAMGGRWQVSRGDGYLPTWTKAGRELLYVASGRIVAQAVDPAKPYEAKGSVQDLGETTVGAYAASPDGTKLIRPVVSPGNVSGQLVVVKNWHAALQK